MQNILTKKNLIQLGLILVKEVKKQLSCKLSKPYKWCDVVINFFVKENHEAKGGG